MAKNDVINKWLKNNAEYEKQHIRAPLPIQPEQVIPAIQLQQDDATFLDDSDDDANWRANLSALRSSTDYDSDDSSDDDDFSDKEDASDEESDYVVNKGDDKLYEIQPDFTLDTLYSELHKLEPENTEEIEHIGYSKVELEFDPTVYNTDKIKQQFVDYDAENTISDFFGELTGLDKAAHIITDFDADLTEEEQIENLQEAKKELTSNIIASYQKQCAALIRDKKYFYLYQWAKELLNIVYDEIALYSKTYEHQDKYFQLLKFISEIKNALNDINQQIEKDSVEFSKTAKVTTWLEKNNFLAKIDNYGFSPAFRENFSKLNKLLEMSLIDDINRASTIMSCNKAIDNLYSILINQDGSQVKTNLPSDIYNFKQKLQIEIDKISNKPVKTEAELNARNDQYVDITIFVNKTIGEILVIADERKKIDLCEPAKKPAQIKASSKLVCDRLYDYRKRYIKTPALEMLFNVAVTIGYTLASTSVDAFAGAIAGGVTGFFIGNIPGAITGVVVGAGAGGLASLPVNIGIALKTFGLLGNKDKGLVEASEKLVNRAEKDLIVRTLAGG